MNLISHLLEIAVIRYLRIGTDCLLQTTRILPSRVGWGGVLSYMYDIFSTVILASHSSHSLSPLGVAMRSSQLPIGSF